VSGLARTAVKLGGFADVEDGRLGIAPIGPGFAIISYSA
jgi:hypothetical protein